MLKLERVSKVYKVGTFGRGELNAVRDVSFELSPGEVVSLIGESGSGKSTIGRMILRLTPISAGAITFDGVDVSRLKRGRVKGYYREVQGVFQDPFSSYNPIFKADRVFSLIRGAYFPSLSSAEWTTKLHSSLEAVSLEPSTCLNKYPTSSAAGSCSGC